MPAEPAGLTLALAPTLAAIGEAQAALRDFMAAAEAPPGLIFRAELVLEEMLANVVRHAGLPAEARIGLDARLVAEGVRLEVADHGPEFDPRSVPEPAVPASLEEAVPGGLGLKLIRSMAGAIDYARLDDTNRFSVTVVP